jgi:two-component system NtrC family sensor kinase
MTKKKRHYRTLTKLLAAGFFICGIFPVLIIATTSVYNSKQVAIKDLEITASQVVQHRQDVIQKFLGHQLELLSTLISLYYPEHLKDLTSLNNLFLAISKSGGIVDLQMIDTSGEQLAYVGPYKDLVTGKNYREQQWFSEVLVRGSFVSDVFRGYRASPHFVVALTDPLKSYVLRTTINSSVFNSLLYSAQIGAHGDVFIVNRQGELQTPSLQNATSLTDREKQLIHHHTGPEISREGDTLYTTIWLNSDTWLLMLKVHIPDMLGPYYDHLGRTLMIITIVALLFLGIAIFLSRYIIAHIEKADMETTAIDQQMAQIEKMANIGRLAAGIAHEVNNPLQMILTQVDWLDELLLEENPSTFKNFDEYAATTRKVKHHVSRAATITNRLLGFSRKVNAEQESVDVNALVQESLSFLEKEAFHNKIDINLMLAPELPATMTEGSRLQQILLNLIDNALDAVGHDGKVDITTTNTDSDIIIHIADNGPGIPPEILNKIWDPFFTTKEQGKGTGLGLSISQNIMRTLGGTIDVKNGDSGGAVFTLKIPIIKIKH